MIEPHLFIFAFQNFIYIYISQHRATGGSWSITTAVVKICHRHSPISYLSFRNGLDLPCFLGFDKPPILKRKNKSFPHFRVYILKSFHLTSFLKRLLVSKCCRCLMLIKVYFYFSLRILRPWQSTEPRSITNTTVCTKCGGAGHISSDCKFTRWSSVIIFPLPSSLPPSGYCTINFRQDSEVNCFSLLLSSFAQRPGEPPQSAQDKARMDKEYLSLMAELGEAPVPGSSGGHSNPSPSGPRPAGHNNNQPPPVSPKTSIFPYWRPISS